MYREQVRKARRRLIPYLGLLSHLITLTDGRGYPKVTSTTGTTLPHLGSAALGINNSWNNFLHLRR